MQAMSDGCFAGRVLFGGGGLDPSLNWQTPCPVPAEYTVPMVPPMLFCVIHYATVMDSLYCTLERLGMIDHSIMAQAPDEFDAIVLRLREQQQ